MHNYGLLVSLKKTNNGVDPIFHDVIFKKRDACWTEPLAREPIKP
jgi:hypothetical protein